MLKDKCNCYGARVDDPGGVFGTTKNLIKKFKR